MSYGERDPHYAYPDRQTARTYSQDELDAAVAAERERWVARVEEAFREGYCSRETYNDEETSCADDQWACAKASLLRA